MNLASGLLQISINAFFQETILNVDTIKYFVEFVQSRESYSPLFKANSVSVF